MQLAISASFSLCKPTAQAVAKYTELCVKLSLFVDLQNRALCSLLSTHTPPQVISESSGLLTAT